MGELPRGIPGLIASFLYCNECGGSGGALYRRVRPEDQTRWCVFPNTHHSIPYVLDKFSCDKYGGFGVPPLCEAQLQQIPYYYKVGSEYAEDDRAAQNGDGFLVGKPKFIMYFRPDSLCAVEGGRYYRPWKNSLGQSGQFQDPYTLGHWYVCQTFISTNKCSDPCPHRAPLSEKVLIGTPPQGTFRDAWPTRSWVRISNPIF